MIFIGNSEFQCFYAMIKKQNKKKKKEGKGKERKGKTRKGKGER